MGSTRTGTGCARRRPARSKGDGRLPPCRARGHSPARGHVVAGQKLTPARAEEGETRPEPQLVTEGVRSIPPKRVHHPTHQLRSEPTIQVRGNSEEMAHLRPLEVLIVHDGRETPMAAMPPAVIPAPHALRRDTRDGAQVRPVQTMPTRSPDAAEEPLARRP